MTLNLDSSGLPTPATNCVVVGHAQKADVVWTRDDFMALCEHMMNGNERNFFLIPYRKEDGTAHYAKAKNARADRRASWAWDTITGRAKNPASIGFYPRNAEGKTRWGGIDFDAHGGNGAERARKFAFDAFGLLMRHPQLFVVLATSGSGGWHLFVFTLDFHDCTEWERLFRQLAAMIGTPIEKGVLEIFPSATRGRIGYGLRAPGSLNPKNGCFGLIAYQNFTDLCAKRRGERDSLFLSRSKNSVRQSLLTYREEKPVYRGEFDEWQARFAIIATRTRREKLKTMVDHIFRQVGREVARRNAELQYNEKTVPTAATLSEHLQEFDELWEWWETQWLTELSDSERKKFDALHADSNDREAFRIIRNFARLIKDGSADFKIVAEHLAKRIAVTLQTACNIRQRFCGAGILEQTAEHVPQKFAARFRWAAYLEMGS